MLTEKSSTSTVKSKASCEVGEKSSQDKEKPSLNELRMNRLFIRFGSIYGRIWWNNFPNEISLNEAKKEWGETLEAFENSIIKKAIERTRVRTKLPPTLPEFFDVCKAISRRNDEVTKASEFTKSQPEIAERYISEMRKVLPVQH